MAYTQYMSAQLDALKGAIPLRNKSGDSPSWLYWRSHYFTTEVTTSAQSLKSLLGAQTVGSTAVRPLAGRRTVLISNPSPSAAVYLGFGTVSTTAYQFYLGTVSGFVEIPLEADADVYVIGSAGSQPLVVTEIA